MVNPEPIKNNKKDHHHIGFERYVLDKYADQIKYAHNSVHNPKYPTPKKKDNVSKNRIKFTVIGNRVNKEFIHCSQLVKGLHKYRPKEFDAPVIRGVTGVEWPKVWNDLKIHYGGIAFCINNPVIVLIDDNLLGGDIELKEFIAQKYTYHLTLDYYKLAVQEFARFVNSSGRPCAYMHISINNEHVGTFIFMLYADLTPQTCNNFLRLCQVTKGGYSGTPVHRIVRDSWIQCGGFGLKSSDLKCENFMIPHDRRGVLCMANDGRHVDCSTQFFILLQPQPWMAHKYVAFGQLIDGEEMLKKIEDVPTFYESPKSEIIITKAGILNLECQDITINKMTLAYLRLHVEDLFALGKLLWDELEEKAWALIVNRELKRSCWNELMRKVFALVALKNDIWNMVFDAAYDEIEILLGLRDPEEEEEEDGPQSRMNVRATQRFMRNKSDLQQHALDQDQVPEEANNDFDVEEYSYSPEEFSYAQATPGSESIVLKAEKAYYLPFTDVPYPGEVGSEYNLIRILKGNYCLEADIAPHDATYKKKPVGTVCYCKGHTSESLESLNSNDEREIRKYCRVNADKFSFAGNIISKMAEASGMMKMRDRYYITCPGSGVDGSVAKKVCIAVPKGEDKESDGLKIRQTGFVEACELIKSDSDAETNSCYSKKVRIAVQDDDTQKRTPIPRRQTGFVKPASLPPDDSDDDDDDANGRIDDDSSLQVPMQIKKPSVLKRLMDQVKVNGDTCNGPTLKDYRPLSELQKNFLLTHSSAFKGGDNRPSRTFLRQRESAETSLEPMLSLQHGTKFARKISSDYVNTIDQAEHKTANSIRSIEYAKTRPKMSVEEYQLRNQRYQEMKAHEQIPSQDEVTSVMEPTTPVG